MKIKDFFYFTKGQRIGIIILLILIVSTLLMVWLLPSIFEPKEEKIDTAFLQEAEKFRANLKEKERSKKSSYEYDDDKYERYDNNHTKTNESSHYQLFAFDPNTIDSADFVRLGIKPYIAKNILRYRSKGGKFRKPEDFSKVYGLAPEKFNELQPFIQITSTENRKMTDYPEQISDNQNSITKEANVPVQKKNITVDLNSADTTLLMQISGIGKTYAKRIVGYRKLLGGYASVEQLQEVYGMTPENFQKISPQCRVDRSQIHKIDVNTASIEKLKSHPYIKTFQKAKVIYEYRRKKVKLKTMDDLNVLNELNGDDLKKLEPYLEFK